MALNTLTLSLTHLTLFYGVDVCWKRSWIGSISGSIRNKFSISLYKYSIFVLFFFDENAWPFRWYNGRLLASSVLDSGFDLIQSNQRLQNWYLLVSRLAVLKGSYRLVGLMCLSKETMRTLELCNNPSVVCWSGTKWTSSLLFSLTMVSICLHIRLHTFHVI